MMIEINIPGSIRSTVFSSMLSFVATRVAARSIRVGSTLLVSSLMCLPHNQVAKVITTALLSRLLPITALHTSLPAPKLVTRAHARPASKGSSLSPQIKLHPISEDERQLYLHEMQHEYIWTFSGKITCGESICHSANVVIHVASKRHPNLSKTAEVQPDGSYTAHFKFTEHTDQYVDWWIDADSPDSATRQIQGRQILTDDAEVNVNTPLELL